MIKEVNSVSNPIIKLIVSLNAKKNIAKNNITFVEGEKIVMDLLDKNYPVKSIFLASDYVEILPKLKKYNKDVFLISDSIVKKVSNTITSKGVFALVELPFKNAFNANEKYIVLDNIQDPTNLGAIVRSALAFNYKQIILVNSVYPFLPKVIRSSMGYVFNVNFHYFSNKEFINFANSNNLKLLCAKMQGEPIKNFKQNNENYGLVVGNEGNGVSYEIQNICKNFISISMNNGVESLNVAISASIIMHELN